MTLSAGVVFPPTQQPAAAPQMPTPTVLPVAMPAASAPPHDLSYQPPAPVAPAPVAPPTQMQPAGAPVLNDPSLPPELQGKSMSEMVQYYNKLRDYYLTQTQGAPPAPTNAPAAPAVPQAPVAAPAAEPSAADFWADPVETIRRVVGVSLAPVTQTALQSQVVSARNTVAQASPYFAALEGKVLEKLNGLAPEQLTQPGLWQQAYHMALGEATANGWVPPTPAPTAPTAAPAAPAVNANPRPFAPTQFFTEPSRPNAGPAAALTPEQQAMATKLSMSHEDYMKWLPGGAR